MAPYRPGHHIETRHIPHPYAHLTDDFLAPQEPTLYDALAHPMDEERPWVWSDTGFTRDLTHAEQDAFTAFLEPCFHPHYASDHPATTFDILTLSLANGPFARALTQAIRTLGERFQYPYGKPTATRIHSPFSLPHLWAAIWPWLDQDLRAALIPLLCRHLTLSTHVAFQLIDPTVPPMLNLGPTDDRECRALSFVRTPRSEAQVLEYLRHTMPHDQVTTLIEETLLRWASTDLLDALYADPRMTESLAYVFWCPHASPALVQRACLAHRVRHQDGADSLQLPVHGPYWATIDPITPFLDPAQPRITLQEIVPWLNQHPYYYPHVIKPTETTQLQQILETEWNGPYADLAELVWRGGMATPPPVRSPGLSSETIQWHSADALLNDPSTPEALLAMMFLSRGMTAPPARYARRIARHPNLTPALAMRMSHHANPLVRTAIATHPLLPTDEHRRLAHDANMRVQSRAIRTQPLDTLNVAALLDNPHPMIRAGLAQHPHLPHPIQTRLSADPSIKVRKALLANPALHPTCLQHLAHDPSPSVRTTVAKHPQSPPPLLIDLAHDRNLRVRLAVAQHPATPASALSALAARAGRTLEQALLTHPALPAVDRVRLTVKYSG